VRTESRFRNIGRGLTLLVAVLIVGVVGFMALEHYTFLEAVYMTVITISTVGFREIHDPSRSGYIFVIFLILAGLSVLTYTLGAGAQLLIEGQIRRLLGRHRMQREIENLKGHYIICGYGRMGQILCQELRAEGVPFVVVEQAGEAAEDLREQGFLVVEGDATQDEILERAGIARAKGLVAVVSSDVDNLYIVLSAREETRQSNPGLYILARASDSHATKKIARAGANRVISPYQIGGMRIVQALLRPNAYDFVEVVTQSSGLDLMIEEVPVGEKSALISSPLKDSGIRQKYDMIIIGIKKHTADMIFNPGPGHVIEAGDVLIVLGSKTQVAELSKVLA
jgi:voltage-gated potassium channel